MKPIPEIRPNEKTIVVIGLPATGKSFITALLQKHLKGKPVKVYHTDDYMKYEFKEALYVLMNDLKKDISPIKLIEGIQGYRLLRKGLELNSFYPDLVIICVATRELRQQRYLERGKTFNRGFDASLNKIWNDYITALKNLDIRVTTLPRFIIYNTLTGKTQEA